LVIFFVFIYIYMARTTRRFKRNIAVGGKRTRRNIRRNIAVGGKRARNNLRKNTRKIGGKKNRITRKQSGGLTLDDVQKAVGKTASAAAAGSRAALEGATAAGDFLAGMSGVSPNQVDDEAAITVAPAPLTERQEKMIEARKEDALARAAAVREAASPGKGVFGATVSMVPAAAKEGEEGAAVGAAPTPSPSRPPLRREGDFKIKKDPREQLIKGGEADMGGAPDFIKNDLMREGDPALAGWSRNTACAPRPGEVGGPSLRVKSPGEGCSKKARVHLGDRNIQNLYYRGGVKATPWRYWNLGVEGEDNADKTEYAWDEIARAKERAISTISEDGDILTKIYRAALGIDRFGRIIDYERYIKIINYSRDASNGDEIFNKKFIEPYFEKVKNEFPNHDSVNVMSGGQINEEAAAAWSKIIKGRKDRRPELVGAVRGAGDTVNFNAGGGELAREAADLRAQYGLPNIIKGLEEAFPETFNVGGAEVRLRHGPLVDDVGRAQVVEAWGGLGALGDVGFSGDESISEKQKQFIPFYCDEDQRRGTAIGDNISFNSARGRLIMMMLPKVFRGNRALPTQMISPRQKPSQPSAARLPAAIHFGSMLVGGGGGPDDLEYQFRVMKANGEPKSAGARRLFANGAGVEAAVDFFINEGESPIQVLQNLIAIDNKGNIDTTTTPKSAYGGQLVDSQADMTGARRYIYPDKNWKNDPGWCQTKYEFLTYGPGDQSAIKSNCAWKKHIGALVYYRVNYREYRRNSYLTKHPIRSTDDIDEPDQVLWSIVQDTERRAVVEDGGREERVNMFPNEVDWRKNLSKYIENNIPGLLKSKSWIPSRRAAKKAAVGRGLGAGGGRGKRTTRRHKKAGKGRRTRRR
jgi:hypothetical protein